MEKVVLLTANYKGKPYDIVRDILPERFRLITLDELTHDEVVKKIPEADYLLASGNLKIDEEVLSAAKKLQMVQRLGVGLDSLDFDALKKYDIPVYVNKGVNAQSVAEHSVMFILAALRNLTIISSNTKNGIWKKQEQGVNTRELGTQVVGIVGMGNIGRLVAGMLKPFGCKVLYYDMYRPDTEVEEELNLEYHPVDEIFQMADVITLHCPMTDETKNLICEQNIRKMKDGVVIVNTSRGGLIDGNDLLNALNSGKVGMACLDVFPQEPIKDFSLVQHEHVICTPHIAGNTFDSFSKMMKAAISNIEMFDQGKRSEIEQLRINRQ